MTKFKWLFFLTVLFSFSCYSQTSNFSDSLGISSDSICEKAIQDASLNYRSPVATPVFIASLMNPIIGLPVMVLNCQNKPTIKELSISNKYDKNYQTCYQNEAFIQKKKQIHTSYLIGTVANVIITIFIITIRKASK